jgi:hypothetical protein
MLRPAITLLKDLGPSLQAGISWSSVRFPSGQISSNQIGLTLAWRNEFAYLNAPMGSSTSPLSESTGLGFDRMSVTASRYTFSNGPSRRIELAGAQAERRSDIPGFTWGMEAAAAAKGDAAGYLELLGSGAYSTALFPSALPSWRVGVRLAAGLAGGGSVSTGGGLIGKAAVTTEVGIAGGWTAGADYGRVWSANGDMRAKQTRIWLGIDLEPGLGAGDSSMGHVVRTEWVAAIQHHARVLRRDGSREPLDTIGLELNRYINEHIYVSGQVHSAFSGGAGAYSVGLVGVGLATSADAPWRAGLEVLAGASGGGGVQTAGGAIGQGMLWAGWRPAAQSEFRAGVGVMRGLGSGGRESPIVQVSWSRAFGMVGR